MQQTAEEPVRLRQTKSGMERSVRKSLFIAALLTYFDFESNNTDRLIPISAENRHDVTFFFRRWHNIK